MDSAATLSTTSVHPKATSTHHPRRLPYRAFLLQRDPGLMSIATALAEYLDPSYPNKKVARLESCRTRAMFYANRLTSEIRVMANSCKVPWCPLCCRARQFQIRTNTEAWLRKAESPKLLTLTMKHRTTSLIEQIDHLYASFKRLRRHLLFRKSVTGGIWFFQVTYKQHTGEWHPHLHCMVSGRYMPQKTLSRLWYQASEGSSIVDIRIVKNLRWAAGYVARYAVNPAGLRDMPLEQLAELHIALSGRRKCGTWGTAFRHRLTARPKFDKTQWQRLFTWTEMLNLYGLDDRVTAVVHAWQADEPLYQLPDFSDFTRFMSGAPPLEAPEVESYEQMLLF